VLTTFKRSAVAARRSTVTLGETVPLGPQQQPALITTSGKRRRATRPSTARPRRHHRSKVVDETVHRRRAAGYPEIESPSNDHQGHGPSTPPPSDDNCVDVIHRATTTTQPPTTARRISSACKRTAATKPTAAATCSVTFTTPVTPGCTNRQSRRRRTPSFHDLVRGQPSPSSTVKLPPPVAAVYPSVTVGTPAQFYAEAPRLTTAAFRPRTLLPSSSSSFPARRIGSSSRRLTLPADWLRHSHGSSAAALRFMTPASRSVLLSAGDFSELQASMQVIGLGNTVWPTPHKRFPSLPITYKPVLQGASWPEVGGVGPSLLLWLPPCFCIFRPQGGPFSPLAGCNIKIRLKTHHKRTILTPKYQKKIQRLPPPDPTSIVSRPTPSTTLLLSNCSTSASATPRLWQVEWSIIRRRNFTPVTLRLQDHVCRVLICFTSRFEKWCERELP